MEDVEEDFLNSPRLGKGFFWLTDALFVITAIILAFTKEGAVTPWIIIALLVGALIGAFPYVLEYLTRAQMHEPVESPELDQLKDSINKVSDYAQGLEAKMVKFSAKPSGKSSISDRDEVSEELADIKNELNLLQGSLEKSWKAFNERIHNLEVLLSQKVDNAAIDALRQEIDQLHADLNGDDLGRSPTSGKNLLSQALSKAKKEKDTTQVNRLIRTEAVDEELDVNESSSDKAVPIEKTSSKKNVAAQSNQLEEPELIAVDTVVKKSSQASKKATVVEAQTLIGIGNKPYIRGEGAGLSWQKGQLMEFVEIGKWRWVAPECKEAVTYKIYKNDEEAAIGEGWTVEPGDSLQCSPKFS